MAEPSHRLSPRFGLGASGKRRPNILITIADDQQPGTLGCLGHPDIQTPWLDRLAGRGTTYTHSYIMGSTSPAVCIPTRAMLHTGRSLYDLPINMLTPGMIPQELSDCSDPNEMVPTLGQLLGESGYRTFLTGKWHNGCRSLNASFQDGAAIFLDGMGEHQAIPIHRYDPMGAYPNGSTQIGQGYSSDLFSDAAVRFLDHYNEDDPFFLYVAYTAPHDPRSTPPGYADRYEANKLTLPDNAYLQHPFDNGEMDIRDEMLAQRPLSETWIRQELAHYYAMITHMDAGIGRIHTALNRNGYGEDTIIIHLSDHGLALGRHGLLGKQNLYEHSVRVPLLIAGPGITKGEQVNKLCYSHDLFPTLCELGHVPVPQTCRFQSLLPMLSSQGEAGRAFIFSGYQMIQRMITDGQNKLIRYFVDGQTRSQLFDLQTDPDEMHNLVQARETSNILRALDAALITHQKEYGDPLLETEL